MGNKEERISLGREGAYGTDVLDGAGSLSGGPWCALIAKGATTTSSLTGNWSALPGAMADGEVITGRFTAVTISGGKLYCQRSAEASTELPIATKT